MDTSTNSNLPSHGRALRPPRLSAAQRAQILGEYRSSGLTQERFATARNLNVETLRGWLYRPQGDCAPPAPASPAASGGFVPVRLLNVQPMATPANAGRSQGQTATITLRWPQAAGVELVVSLDGAALAGVLRELLGPCSR